MTTDKLLTSREIEALYPSVKYYIAALEIDSLFEGKTRHYLVVNEKTGERNKYGSYLYKAEKLYFQLWDKKGNYKLVADPYKK